MFSPLVRPLLAVFRRGAYGDRLVAAWPRRSGGTRLLQFAAPTSEIARSGGGCRQPSLCILHSLKLCGQPSEQRLRFLQIERVEAFGEPAVDRRQQLACGVALAALDQQLRERRRTAQLPGSGLLPARAFD